MFNSVKSKIPSTKSFINKKEVIKNKCWLLQNILTPEECKVLIEGLEKQGFDPVGSMPEYRSCFRKQFKDKELGEWLWQKIKSHVPNSLMMEEDKEGEDEEIDEDDEEPEPELFFWQAVGLYDLPRCCKYSPGHHFASHYDYAVHPNPGEQSFFTFMLYLNEGFEGGETHFMDPNDEKKVVYTVVPKSGTGIMFLQGNIPGLLHQGAKVIKGTSTF